MLKAVKIGLIVGIFGLLVLVRYFQEALFYDPLLDFFRSDFLEKEHLPDFRTAKLIFALTERYFLNSILSLLVLWIAFNEKGYVKFAALLYLIAFVLLLVIFYMLLKNYEPEHYQLLFYMRRFLIQPLFIIIILPAFYYQKTREK
tara:strand:- start:64 stop:498 length:435 start_codon:yes stop_codon:yes gene_type:complete